MVSTGLLTAYQGQCWRTGRVGPGAALGPDLQDVGPSGGRTDNWISTAPRHSQGQPVEGRGRMSSNTSPTGAQHQGEASSSKNPVLSTPYEEPAGVRRQSVFHAAANNTAPHERSTSTDSDDMNEDMGSTEEIEVVAPSAVAAPGTDNELQHQPASESSTGTEGPATTDDADSDSAAFAGPGGIRLRSTSALGRGVLPGRAPTPSSLAAGCRSRCAPPAGRRRRGRLCLRRALRRTSRSWDDSGRNRRLRQEPRAGGRRH